MQLKTYLSIGTGIAVGMIFGMGVSEKTKYKVLTKIKKKVVYLITGEEWTPKPSAPLKKTTYASYYTKKSETEKKEEPYTPDRKLFLFKTEEEAKECLDWIADQIYKNGIVSVHELAHHRCIAADYTWDRYGWAEIDFVMDMKIVPYRPEDSGVWQYKFKLEMPSPLLLD